MAMLQSKQTKNYLDLGFFMGALAGNSRLHYKMLAFSVSCEI